MANGSTIRDMDKVKKCGLMAHSSKVSLLKARKRVLDILNGLTVHHTKGISKTTPFMARVSTNGLMAVHSTETGKTIKCMVVDFSSGKMDVNILVSIKKTRSMVVACLCGQMVDNTMANG